MEIKKTPKADLQNKKGLFLEIGLAVSLLLSIALFNYSQSEKTIDELDMGMAMVEEDIIEITNQEEKQPEPVKQQIAAISDVINVVKNDTKITNELDFSEYTEDAITVEKTDVNEAVSGDAGEIFLVVETMPKFQGGDLQKFRNWVIERLRYPDLAAENGVEGRVVLSFVVEKDGTLTNIELLNLPDRSLSEEAIRVLKTSPKWTPGKQRNIPARVKYTIPVDFQME